MSAVIDETADRVIIDFGQNLVGRLRIRLKGARGRQLTLRHAEVLENGELSLRPLREARATDTYISAGDEIEVWEPQFTFHGFRYAEISGWPGQFDPAAVTAVVIHSDLRRTGHFATSHKLLDQLHRNVVWGMRGNFLSVPTDCPQRDERLGWTGDIQVFAPTASYLYDVNEFLAGWLHDLDLEQKGLGGTVPRMVPFPFRDEFVAAGWGDAATIVPATLYERFADAGILERQLRSMSAWVDDVRERSGPGLLWQGTPQFGDWLDPDAPADHPDRAKADPDVIATSYFYRSASLVGIAAGIVGDDARAARYAALAESIRDAFLEAYVGVDGRIRSDAPTVYALAIAFGLYRNKAELALMGDRLSALAAENGHRISTGFLGTPVILDALTETGHLDDAVALITQTANPSWLYSVIMGATTVWERWDSLLEDGSVNPGEMTSFNHYALGSVADWMHRVLAGISPAEPGYRVAQIAPHVVDGIDWISAGIDSPYGPFVCEWKRTDGGVVIDVSVPPNASALITLPSSEPIEVGSGDFTWTIPDPSGASGGARAVP